MAYQFIHIETYSEASKRVRGAEGHFNSAKQVLGEAQRQPEYSTHVRNPGEVWPLAGTMSVKELQKKRYECLKITKETVARKDGTTYQRKLRTDAATLYTEIHSHPMTTGDYLSAPDEHCPTIQKWCNLAIANFEDRMPIGIDWAAVMHFDESHMHFHILAINTFDPKLDANKLHIGKAAASKVRAEQSTPSAIAPLPKPALEKRPPKPKQPRPSKRPETQRKNKVKHEAQLETWRKKCNAVDAKNTNMKREWKSRNSAHVKEARKSRGAIPEKQAYSDAMKLLQDSYYQNVGKPCGLLRHGPRQERLSTKEYEQRKRTTLIIEKEQDKNKYLAALALAGKEKYEEAAIKLAAKEAELKTGIAAFDELASQLKDGRARIAGGQIQMTDPPLFLTHLFDTASPETEVTRLFRDLLAAIRKMNQTGQNETELERGAQNFATPKPDYFDT